MDKCLVLSQTRRQQCVTEDGCCAWFNRGDTFQHATQAMIIHSHPSNPRQLQDATHPPVIQRATDTGSDSCNPGAGLDIRQTPLLFCSLYIINKNKTFKKHWNTKKNVVCLFRSAMERADTHSYSDISKQRVVRVIFSSACAHTEMNHRGLGIFGADQNWSYVSWGRGWFKKSLWITLLPQTRRPEHHRLTHVHILLYTISIMDQ